MPYLPSPAESAAAALLVALALTACTGPASGSPGDGERPGASATAPSAPSDPQPPAAPRRVADPGDVVGRLVDAAGRPVEGALVDVLRWRDVPEVGLLADRTPRRTWTDENGRFRVRQAADGYLVRACHPDAGDRRVCASPAEGVPHLAVYAGPAGTTDSWVTQTSLFRARSADRRLGTLRASAPASVVGRLDGAPFTEVRVMRLNDTLALRTATDAEGRYRARGLVGGPYYVAAGGAGALPWRSAAFDLPPGGRHRVAAARLDPGATLTGRVTSAGGAAVAGVELLVRRSGEVVAATGTDETGTFRVPGLDGGSYAVELAPGSRWAPARTAVEVPAPSGVHDASLTVRRGAVLVVPLRTPRDPDAGRIHDELRDAAGRPLLMGLHRQGRVVYPGLAAGRYTVVAATSRHYGMRTADLASAERRELAPLRLRRDTLTVRGRTAPRAVVEATTSDLCPPGGNPRRGAFHAIERADTEGRYRLTGLVPGTVMLGADGWPGTHAPRCWPGVELTGDLRRDLPLDVGGVVTGRLVYAATGGPVITNLSYELTYPDATATSPTDEHPARARADRASGLFEIRRLGPATVTGALANEADFERLTSLRFAVIHPYQDATPYWLASERTVLDVGPGIARDLGDVPLVLHPLPEEVPGG